MCTKEDHKYIDNRQGRIFGILGEGVEPLPGGGCRGAAANLRSNTSGGAQRRRYF